MIIKYMGKLYIISYDLYAIMERYENMPSDLKEGAAALYKEGCIGHIQGAIIEISVPEYISFLESIPSLVKCNLDDEGINNYWFVHVQIMDLVPSTMQGNKQEDMYDRAALGAFRKMILDEFAMWYSKNNGQEFVSKSLKKHIINNPA